jgi:endonuclease YncB( thermonuclease family)
VRAARRWLPVFVLALLGASTAQAQTSLLGRVVGVTAGNGLRVQLEDGARVQVVLAYLAIPRDDQPYAARAHAVLRAQLLDQAVNVRPVGVQGEGYVRALVYVRGQNFNEDFLRRGHAWANPLDAPPGTWYGLQAAAQAAGVGLWAAEAPVHPVEWGTVRRDAESMVSGEGRLARDVTSEQWRRVLIGDRRTRRYLPFGCRAWTAIPQTEVAVFVSSKAAESEGFRPAPCP